ncbi:hypothetical protein PACTADRAFT_185665 [Pachysolen tannophilus NRRL Y-2460]|uniref:Uncharacterized protein n=1 Tax=Pachysolen tannophilus NRRL Y-2460 TaxID=669874 RepID=A0A1E4U1X3_PACTA|nr:hypothetical protein PACTADRAFT_185665 [Pachysolen tannophilus NRRL Y-2460]
MRKRAKVKVSSKIKKNQKLSNQKIKSSKHMLEKLNNLTSIDDVNKITSLANTFSESETSQNEKEKAFDNLDKHRESDAKLQREKSDKDEMMEKDILKQLEIIGGFNL